MYQGADANISIYPTANHYRHGVLIYRKIPTNEEGFANMNAYERASVIISGISLLISLGAAYLAGISYTTILRELLLYNTPGN